MASRIRTERRRDALSKARVVEAAIDILDRVGEDGLTFRALAAHLATGSGAIYWHVTDKNDLLAAATDHVIARVMADAVGGSTPQDVIRTMALGVFDTIHAHPWVGGQLSRNPWQHAVLRMMEGIGGQVQALGVPEQAQFNSVTALLSFVLGLAGQYAAGARRFPHGTDRVEVRKAVLQTVAAKWMELDPAAHPFVRQVAEVLPEHDDREQFLAGIDLILAGMESIR
ncbi:MULTISPECIES: TetR family transcriptional regulator [unclassified Rhizobium]|jgi:AcrR family transcriptional regulator|uniref:TetR/AcrR family transcriptional regulator n=1 Tax=unclassified Rhizobium TaxID=2613769 RepID=UPI0006459EEF|nr:MULTISPECIES: TetR family transcriptional regulator [unclassified Rhizobium]OJY74095.1 MAG: TetR family transcriptional regulator [Rhizobium sp. 60-20]RKD61477.1 TetR family transcriptional regulator [Rhizobium sp. WW_1]